MQDCRFHKSQNKGKIYGFDKVWYFSRKLYSKCIKFALEYLLLKDIWQIEIYRFLFWELMWNNYRTKTAILYINIYEIYDYK